jgi:lipooligosaccharide transport system permease protein
LSTDTPTAHLVRPHGGGVGALLGVNFIILRKFLVGAIISNTLSPLLYLWSLGIGLGGLVNANHPDTIGTSYVAYVAPGLIAASALQIATAESMFPIMVGFRWVRRYYSMNATPLSATQICAGQLWTTVIQLAVASSIYLAMVAAFGGVKSFGAVLIVPIAILGAMAFAGLISAYAATLDRETSFFNFVIRFMVIPMFLFSGTFYPLKSLPGWAQDVAMVSPLWHATELCRAVALGPLHLSSGVGHISMTATVVHLAYLSALALVGISLTVRNFRVRLAS